jgi:hypothetical protein
MEKDRVQRKESERQVALPGGEPVVRDEAAMGPEQDEGPEREKERQQAQGHRPLPGRLAPPGKQQVEEGRGEIGGGDGDDVPERPAREQGGERLVAPQGPPGRDGQPAGREPRQDRVPGGAPNAALLCPDRHR